MIFGAMKRMLLRGWEATETPCNAEATATATPRAVPSVEEVVSGRFVAVCRPLVEACQKLSWLALWPRTSRSFERGNMLRGADPPPLSCSGTGQQPPGGTAAGGLASIAAAHQPHSHQLAPAQPPLHQPSAIDHPPRPWDPSRHGSIPPVLLSAPSGPAPVTRPDARPWPAINPTCPCVPPFKAPSPSASCRSRVPFHCCCTGAKAWHVPLLPPPPPVLPPLPPCLSLPTAQSQAPGTNRNRPIRTLPQPAHRRGVPHNSQQTDLQCLHPTAPQQRRQERHLFFSSPCPLPCTTAATWLQPRCVPPPPSTRDPRSTTTTTDTATTGRPTDADRAALPSPSRPGGRAPLPSLVPQISLHVHRGSPAGGISSQYGIASARPSVGEPGPSWHPWHPCHEQEAAFQLSHPTTAVWRIPRRPRQSPPTGVSILSCLGFCPLFQGDGSPSALLLLSCPRRNDEANNYPSR